jgi:hypothetical protein
MADLLTTKKLNVKFKSRGQIIHAVNELSFNLKNDEVLGIVDGMDYLSPAFKLYIELFGGEQVSHFLSSYLLGQGRLSAHRL